jgi:DNA-binding NarL/FixJ family response regulator
MSGQIARQVIRAFQKDPSQGGADLLTATERRVLELLALGLIYKEVAERLTMSLSTVRTHIWHIYRKLEVNNRTEAIRKGLQS